MVAWLFAFCFLLQGYQVDIPAKMTVTVPQNAALEGQPIEVDVEVLRIKKQAVDPTSFQLDGKPIKVDFVGDESPKSSSLFSANDPEALVISRYRFQLPASDRGLFVLGSVTAKVGGVQVRSPQVTYQVTGTVSHEDLSMQAKVVEPSPIYPGQKVTFQYRIYFSRPVELTREEYSLFAISGFRPIGSPKIEDSMDGNVAVQTISQVATALAPGTYRCNPSILEGYVFGEDQNGNKVRLQPKLTVAVAPVEVTITPFPAKNKPPSFNGSIGSYVWKVDRLSSGSVVVGEKVLIRLTAAGRGDFDTVELPDIKTQKGFQGTWRLPDVMPTGVVDQNVKRFDLEIRPLSSDIKAIPSIEFSSFDPSFGKYVTAHSDPEPIQVRKGALTEPSQKNPEILPIEIEGNVALNAKNIQAPEVPPQVLFTLFFILVGLYLLQVVIQKLLKAHVEKKMHESSRDIFLEALKLRQNLEVSLPLIRKALLLRLFEIKEIPARITHPEELADSEIQGDIKRFLLSLERKQFSNLGMDVEAKELIDEASQLYHRMKRSA